MANKQLDKSINLSGTIYDINAVNSDKATNDKNGNDITSYIKGLSISKKNITYTKGDGTTGTITTQDTSALVGGNGTKGLIKNGSTVTSSSGYTACPIISGVPYYKDTNSTYTLSSFGVTATKEELNYVDGVTSNIQTQLNGKAPSSHTHSEYVDLSNAQTISGNKTFTGKNIFTATNNYNTADTQKFLVGNNSSAFCIGGDGLQCFSGTSSTAAKSMYINYYGGDVIIGQASGSQNINLQGIVKENGTALNDKYASKNVATTAAKGLMSAADKTKLDGIATGANKYSLPKASSSALGGVKIGFTESGRNYPVELNSNGQMYVNVPWYDSSYSTATKSVSGLMSASDKSKLDGIASGATSVSFTRSLTSGTKIGTIKINGSSTDLYCNAASGSSGTTISAWTGTQQVKVSTTVNAWLSTTDITLNRKLQSGDKVKVYLRGLNKGYEKYNAAIIEFDVFTVSHSGTNTVVGTGHAIVGATSGSAQSKLITVGVSNTSASKLTINSYALSNNSYASAADTCIYKVEVIR